MKNIHKKIITLLLTVTVMLGCIYVPSTASEAQEQIPSESTSAGESMGNIGNGEIIGEIPETEIEEVVPTYYDYIAPRYNSEISSFDKYSDIRYFIDIGSNMRYNNLEVSYASTLDINLKNYINNTVPYSDVVTVPLIFSVSEPAETVLYTDYHSARFSEIILNLTAYVGEREVETQAVIIYVLNTSNGVYVSPIGRKEVFYKYICDLFNASVINESVFSSAQFSITTPDISMQLSEYNKERIDAILSEKFGTNASIRYYDKTKEEIAVANKNNLLNEDSTSVDSTAVALSEGTDGHIYKEPQANLYSSLTVTNGNEIIIYGRITWTDISSDVVEHPMRKIKVEIKEYDGESYQTLTTLTTNNDGVFSTSIQHDLSTAENPFHLMATVNVKSNDFEVVNQGNYVYLCNLWLGNNITGSQQQEYNLFYGENVIKACQIHQAMVAGYYYYNRMTLNDSSYTTAHFPDYNSAYDVSYSSSTSNDIYFKANAFCSWDTVNHELGHQVARHINAIAPYGGDHSMFENLIESYGLSKGAGLAWNEGFAHFFSQISQFEYDKYVADVSDILSAADNKVSGYTMTVNDDEVKIFKETGGFNFYGKEIGDESVGGAGEGNEMAVAHTLLQLIWDERIALDHQVIWDLISWDGVSSSSKILTFAKFMEKLYQNIPKYLISPIGEWLSYNNIADSTMYRYFNGEFAEMSLCNSSNPKSIYIYRAFVQDEFTPSDRPDNPPQEYIHTYYTSIVFWDEDFNVVYQLPKKTRQSTPMVYTLSDREWSIVLDYFAYGEILYWGIATYQNNSSSAKPYYSSLNRMVLPEKIRTMVQDRVHTCTLVEGIDEWYKFTAPTNGTYTFYSSISWDVKAKLFAGTCLEDAFVTAADSDSGSGTNFLINYSMNAGETVYLKISGETYDVVGTVFVYVIKQ